MTYWYIRHVDEGPIHVGLVGWRSGKDDGSVLQETHFASLHAVRTARRKLVRLLVPRVRAKFKIVRVTRKAARP